MEACAKLSISLIMRTADSIMGYAQIAPVPSPSLNPKCSNGLAFNESSTSLCPHSSPQCPNTA